MSLKVELTKRRKVGVMGGAGFECGEETISFRLAYAAMDSTRQAGDELGAIGADRLP